MENKIHGLLICSSFLGLRFFCVRWFCFVLFCLTNDKLQKKMATVWIKYLGFTLAWRVYIPKKMYLFFFFFKGGKKSKQARKEAQLYWALKNQKLRRQNYLVQQKRSQKKRLIKVHLNFKPSILFFKKKDEC